MIPAALPLLPAVGTPYISTGAGFLPPVGSVQLQIIVGDNMAVVLHWRYLLAQITVSFLIFPLVIKYFHSVHQTDL